MRTAVVTFLALALAPAAAQAAPFRCPQPFAQPDYGLTATQAKQVIDRQNALASAGNAITERLAQRDPGLAAGFEVVDPLTDRSALLLFVTRDPEAVAAQLGDQGVTYRVELRPFSLAFLRAEQARVTPLLEGLRADGIQPAGIGVRLDRNRVVVGAVANNPAAADALIEQRFGPAIEASVRSLGPPTDACVPVRSYRVRGDRRSIVVQFGSAAAVTRARAHVVETRAGVRVTMVTTTPDAVGLVPAVLLRRERIVRLRRPFGDRRVIDGSTGRPVARLRPARTGRGGSLPRRPAAGACAPQVTCSP